MRTYTVDLAIPSHELLRYYRGDAGYVFATSREGVDIRFPARWLQAHVGADGVYGTFRFQVDADFRLQQMTALPRGEQRR